MKIFYTSCIILFFCLAASSQFYNTGQAPASVKWAQIQTENFQVVYPDEFYREANRVANLLEYMYTYISADYDLEPEKISIILYNQSVMSNGYVAWAPRRAEWITTPPIESYSQDWLEQLALHEFRHVVQVNNLEQGITRILNFVFGEAATGAIAGYLPFWFLEGDAVWSETVFSSSGRGRLTDFDRELRAIELDGKKRYSYDQSYLGSYKNFIPDHYSYGYQMVAFAKLKYGNNFWKQTLNHVARNPYLIAPFYLGLKKAGGISKTDLYHNTFDSLNILWNSNLDTNTSTTNLYYNTKQHKFYTQYRYVQPIGGNLFAVRSGIDDISRFVLLNDSSETIIHTPGLYYNTRVSVSKKYIAWEEIIPDMRWAQRNYSVIKVLDRGNGKIKVLQSKTRWFSPELSPNSDSLVCVSIDLHNNFSLLIYDISSDLVVDTLPLHGITNVFSPVWINEHKIACIVLDSEGKHIIEYNLNERSNSVLYSAGFADIEHLSPGGEKLFFTYDYEMARNIYLLDLQSKEIYRVTHSRHGAEFPFYDASNNKLYYSDYTKEGYQPAYIVIDSICNIPIGSVSKYSYSWISDFKDRGSINLQEVKIPQTEYPTKSYNRLLHTLTLHSWLPFYTDPDALISLNPEIYPGFSLFSQNKLSTLTSQLSYYYKDHTHYIEPRFALQGLFPVFEISALFANKPAIYFWPNNLEKPADMQPYYSIAIEAYLPLQLTRNKYYRYVKPEISYRYINRYYYTRDLGIRRGNNYLEASIYASNLLKKSHRDLQPRFGQTLFLAFNQPLIHPGLFTNIVIGQYSQYFPGIFRHHGIQLTISYEGHEELKVPILNSRISPPRGYDPNMEYFGNLRGTFEYTFPVLYPDFSLGPLAYIKRIHASLYYDAVKMRYPQQINNSYVIFDDYFSSFGLILYSEIHFLRFFIPFQPGFRISYLPEKKIFDVGFDITINTSGY